MKSNKAQKGRKGGKTNRHIETGGFMTAPNILMGLGQAVYDDATIDRKSKKGPGSSHAKSWNGEDEKKYQKTKKKMGLD